MASLEEAISAQKELISFLEEQVKIHINFKREAPTGERARCALQQLRKSNE